jgi:hypothetical protein
MVKLRQGLSGTGGFADMSGFALLVVFLCVRMSHLCNYVIYFTLISMAATASFLKKKSIVKFISMHLKYLVILYIVVDPKTFEHCRCCIYLEVIKIKYDIVDNWFSFFK